MKPRFLIACGVLAGLFFVGCQVGPLEVEETPHESRSLAKKRSTAVDGRFIVRFSNDVADAAREAAGLAQRHGFRVGHVYSHALKGFSAGLQPAAVAALRNNPRIEAVESDILMHVVAQTLPTGVDRIDADVNAVADIDNTATGVDVDIAIIDTGIDDDNPGELNVAGGTHFYTSSSGPPWQRGQYQDSNYDDDNGHGSHVAGTAGAIDDNDQVVGAAPGARLWAVKVLDASGSGYLSDIIAGVDWVTANAATIEVANLSLGGQGTSSSFRTAISNCVAAGVVVVVAAGNDGADVYGTDGTLGTDDDYIPASYPEAAAVSAMGDADGQPGALGGSTSYSGDDEFASFTNYSSAVVAGNPVTSPGAAIDVAAPGVDILSTWYDSGLNSISGTSMASPHVAGAVALYIAANGRAGDANGVYAIRQALIDAAQPQSQWGPADTKDPDINPEGLIYVGSGGNQTPSVTITSPSEGAGFVEGETVTFEGTASDLEDGDLSAGLAWESNLDGALGTGATVSSSVLSVGTHTITASVTDDSGATGSDIISITIEAATTDIAVTALSAPLSAVQGDVVAVDVAIENLGNQDVASDITVTLNDDTDAAPIGSQTISGGLAAGGSTVLGFSWNTSSSSLGSHTITATHDLADDEPANNSRSSVVEITDPNATATEVHVGDLDGTQQNDGATWTAMVGVTVHDDTEGLVADATVTCSYVSERGAVSGTVSGATDGNGNVFLSITGIPKRDGFVTFTVDNISHAELSYDAADNHDPDGDSNGSTITVSKP